MPNKDIFHEIVKNALIKEGWTITQDPLYIKMGIVEFFIDLAGEKILAAEKDNSKIAVEIKSFTGNSFIHDFHLALGQCLNYKKALEKTESDRILYLATPLDTYDLYFTDPFIQDVTNSYKLNLIVFNPEKEEIVKWLN